MNKERILQKINDLKVDIQNLIDKKKVCENTDEIMKYDSEKKTKMSALKSLNEDLKKIHKKEKDELKKKNEITRIGRTIDTMEFQGAKNSKQRQVSAKEAKKQREKLKEDYMEYMKKEEVYLKYDPKSLPGYLFLHQDILDNYGLCPYINIEESDNKEINIECIEQNRKDWLLTQNDKGKLYYDLVDNLINKKEIDILMKEKDCIEEKLKDSIFEVMSDSQLELYEKSIIYIDEYMDAVIKTKKLKEKMKMVINNVSILNAELKLPIHEFLTIKYNTQIVVNEVEITDKKEDNESKIIFMYRLESFLKDMGFYKEKIELIAQKNRYIINIMKNLKNELYLYLTNQKTFTNLNKKVIVQSGKYYKRWILLTEEEKLERFNSFCNYYVEKYMIQENILSEFLKQETIDKLEKMIKDAFISKKMVYRDYVWNANCGVLEKVKILRYDREKKEFFLKFTKVNNQENNLQNKSKKKSSTRTIFSKANEKIINEEILYFIVKNESKNTKDDKDKCLEVIKKKMCVKKISSEDKENVSKKYDEIYEVVVSNKKESGIDDISIKHQPFLK